ncbi:MAG: MBL fold metallo-hydrolase [Candidatus Bipolaricaulia bacterium]
MTHPDPRMQPLADNVWVYLPQWRRLEPAIGVILTSQGWVVVDSGNSPVHAGHAWDAMRRIRNVPVRYTINTHRHFDHVFGNQVFGAPVVASRQCRKRFRANLEDDWAPHRVQQWLQQEMLPHLDALALTDFEGLVPVPPTISFQRRLELDVGDTHLELFPSQGAHCDDHVSVFLPEERVLFVGDTFYFHESEGAITRWLKLLDELVQWEADTVVPGHEAPYSRISLELLRAYGHDLFETLISSVRINVPEDEAIRQPLAKRYEDIEFLDARTHRRLARAVYRELAARNSAP